MQLISHAAGPAQLVEKGARKLILRHQWFSDRNNCGLLTPFWTTQSSSPAQETCATFANVP